jgi:hypothetical protein
MMQTTMHRPFHMNKKMKMNEDVGAVSYVQYGSFALPQGAHAFSEPKEFVHAGKAMKPEFQAADSVAKPLHACPGLPKPNQELKYISWNGANVRHSSGINLSQMTHFDHSRGHDQKEKKPVSPPKVSTPEISEEKKPVNDDEMNAVITLSSCFKTEQVQKQIDLSGLGAGISNTNGDTTSKPQSKAC